MQQSPVLWSARACPFRKAGVYYGLSPAHTHIEITERLLPRRGQVYLNGRVRLRASQPLPCVYYAVRDPSVVRVVPVPASITGPERDNGHVSLIFPPPARPAFAPASSEASATEAIQRCLVDQDQAAFVVSVGLRTQREAQFHRQVLLAHHDLPYSELCERIEAVRDDFSD
jgi:hypothetical protein